MSIREAVRAGLIPADTGPDRRNRPQYTRQTPQVKLYEALMARYGDRVRKEASPGVPGRKFRLDAAFPKEKVAVEVDGWKHHSSTNSFKKDRERQNLVVLEGWLVLRYTARRIFRDIDGIISEVDRALVLRLATGGQNDAAHR